MVIFFVVITGEKSTIYYSASEGRQEINTLLENLKMLSCTACHVTAGSGPCMFAEKYCHKILPLLVEATEPWQKWLMFSYSYSSFWF